MTDPSPESDRANPAELGDDEACLSDIPDQTVTIQRASQLLEVPAPTIRSWERRYGVPVADRSSGGHRRYTGAQLAELTRMRDLIARGRRPVEAAALVKAGHLTSPAPLIDALLQGVGEMAPESMARALDVAREALGLDRTVDEVLLPAMREVGDRWHAGQMDVAHEHLATHATQAWLAGIALTPPVRPRPPIVLSCGPLDHHTLGLEAIGALLRERHWACVMLGARTPAESLAHAATDTDAAAVVLVCHLPAGRRAAVEALRSPQLKQRQLFYAGGAFGSPRSRHGVPGHYLGINLGRAADLITATLSSPGASAASQDHG